MFPPGVPKEAKMSWWLDLSSLHQMTSLELVVKV